MQRMKTKKNIIKCLVYWLQAILIKHTIFLFGRVNRSISSLFITAVVQYALLRSNHAQIEVLVRPFRIHHQHHCQVNNGSHSNRDRSDCDVSEPRTERVANENTEQRPHKIHGEESGQHDVQRSLRGQRLRSIRIYALKYKHSSDHQEQRRVNVLRHSVVPIGGALLVQEHQRPNVRHALNECNADTASQQQTRTLHFKA
mmetsp:Transcript_51003/g.84680  ORF Transcript_51003/g.84680 Transcript_51003/m.84680 type:complete len:200 (-) Transcript_51003:892-1491(-)